jgi:O-antigen ligase
VGHGETLRSPHSIHFSILARTGVPGLLLWIGLNLAFAARMIQGFVHARRRGNLFWAQIDGWVLVYWLAFLINASFDVYIEGPQGGIWFWSVVGFGLAALRIQAGEIGRPGGDEPGAAHAYPARP